MKRLTIGFLCLLLALSAAACSRTPPVIELPEPQPLPEVQQPEEQEGREYIPLQWAQHVDPVFLEPQWTVDTDSFTFLKELTDPKYQGRVTGSAGNRAVAHWIESLYVQWGIQPLEGMGGYRHSYPDQVFEVLPGYAAIVAADGTETELVAGEDWIFTPSAVEVDLTLPISNSLEDCAAGTAFFDNGTEVRQEHPYTYIQVGKGDISDGMEHESPRLDAANIRLTREAYAALKADGAKLHLQLPAAASDGTADNVVGYLPGADSTHAVLISAHFDGSGQCGTQLLPGAYDNGSGTAAMLQTASWLSKAENLPCDVIFAAFNGEENGKDGSKYFSSWLKPAYEQVTVINIDCVGWAGEPMHIYAEEDQTALANELAGGLELQYKLQYYNSDQANFKAFNMAAVVITQEICMEDHQVSQTMHSTRDVVDNLDTEAIDRLAKDLSAWVIERGGNTITGTAYRVIW